MAQSLATVQQVDLSPEIHEAVGRRRASQTDDSGGLRDDLLQRPEALGLWVLEAGELVDHDHAEGPVLPALFHQPDYVVPADDVDVGVHGQGPAPLLRRSQHLADTKVAEVVPLGVLSGPCVLGHSLRRDDQDAIHLEKLIDQDVDGGQSDDGLAESHF